ncbi:MAG TPA: cytochrome c [Ignavibacteriaceae bacterium]|nr:cytochrome c [Ignavibacteriaceae bacterium]
MIIKKLKHVNYFLLLIIIGTLGACGDNQQQEPANFANTKKSGNTGELTEFELENGIGPVKKKLTLAPIKQTLVEQGKKIFDTKCAACHKLDERYVGPAQRDVINRRTPEFILNMMLNPEANYQRHPEIKKLLAEYLTQMPNQNLTLDEAKAILDYFRQVVNEKQ